MRIVSIFLATLVLIFSLSACQIVNEEELATIREEGYQQGKESAERILPRHFPHNMTLGTKKATKQAIKKVGRTG